MRFFFLTSMKNHKTIYAICGKTALPKAPAPLHLVLQPLMHKLTDRRIQI